MNLKQDHNKFNLLGQKCQLIKKYMLFYELCLVAKIA